MPRNGELPRTAIAWRHHKRQGLFFENGTSPPGLRVPFPIDRLQAHVNNGGKLDIILQPPADFDQYQSEAWRQQVEVWQKHLERIGRPQQSNQEQPVEPGDSSRTSG